MDTQSSLAFVFPGQGSQSVGMMAALAAEFPQVGARYAAASEELGFDLWDLVQHGPEERLTDTRNAQPALLAASVATWDIWLACGGPRPAYVAGHSFGEYSALVCAGALDYTAAVSLVADRGRFMAEAVGAGEGAMAAVLGLELEPLHDVCAQAAGDEVCECANLNAPGQIVIAGNRAAVDRACALAADAGAKRAMPLPVSVPAHCALMKPAQERLAERLAGITFTSPAMTLLHNVDVATRADADGIRQALRDQMTSPVRWSDTVAAFAADGVTQLCECGPGKVLGGLAKRIDRSLTCHGLADGDAIRTAIEKLQGGTA